MDEKEEHVEEKKEQPSCGTEEYDLTCRELIRIAKEIEVRKAQGDGRIDSAMKEGMFLEKMKRMVGESHPDWEVVIPPPRTWYDIMVNSIYINLKLTDCKSSDNSMNKTAIYYSMTGQTTYPYSSNWNEFQDMLMEAKVKNYTKKERHRPTEYHYLVKNKISGEVLLKPIFDIYMYVSNASNILQINWKKEFIHSEYHTEDTNYRNKMKELIGCIQKSVREMMERALRFAEGDIDSILF